MGDAPDTITVTYTRNGEKRSIEIPTTEEVAKERLSAAGLQRLMVSAAIQIRKAERITPPIPRADRGDPTPAVTQLRTYGIDNIEVKCPYGETQISDAGNTLRDPEPGSGADQERGRS
jgi:hypothetical protein